MTDSTTPTTETADPPTIDPAAIQGVEIPEAAVQEQQAYLKEMFENMDTLQQMRLEDGEVVAKLADEIIERFALLSRFFGMEYMPFFPRNACEFLLLAKWQGDAARLNAFIGFDNEEGEFQEGDAKAKLDALHAGA